MFSAGSSDREFVSKIFVPVQSSKRVGCLRAIVVSEWLCCSLSQVIPILDEMGEPPSVGDSQRMAFCFARIAWADDGRSRRGARAQEGADERPECRQGGGERLLLKSGFSVRNAMQSSLEE